MKLFALYLGGRGSKSLIEVHDVVFCVANSLEEAYPLAKEKWWGLPQHVHIDSYIALTHVDGYKIELTDEPAEESKKLFFLHFGGYEPHLFGEIHRSTFLIGETQAEAIKRGREMLCLGLHEEHLDDCLDIENIMEMREVDGYYLHFVFDPHTPAARAIPGYRFLSCR